MSSMSFPIHELAVSYRQWASNWKPLVLKCKKLSRSIDSCNLHFPGPFLFNDPLLLIDEEIIDEGAYTLRKVNKRFH